MKLSPMNDNVLIKRREENKMTPGGLHIPGTGQSESQEAEVLAVGPGRMLESGHVVPMTVKPGSVVLVPPQSGIKLKFEGQDFLMIQEYNILAIITE